MKFFLFIDIQQFILTFVEPEEENTRATQNDYCVIKKYPDHYEMECP